MSVVAQTNSDGLFFLLPFLLIVLAQIAVSVVLIIGGRAMMNLRSYGLAMTAGVLALVPTGPVWLLSLPVGIWALWVLTRPDVRAAFEALTAGVAQPPTRQKRFSVGWMLFGLLLAALAFVAVLAFLSFWMVLRTPAVPQAPTVGAGATVEGTGQPRNRLKSPTQGAPTTRF